MKITAHVTQQHINACQNGYGAYDCPIARAITDVIGNTAEIYPDESYGGYGVIRDGNKRLKFNLTKKANEFALKLDVSRTEKSKMKPNITLVKPDSFTFILKEDN